MRLGAPFRPPICPAPLAWLLAHLQERAYVTGLAAANMVVDTLGVGQNADILPVEADEPHIVAGRLINRMFKSAVKGLGIKSPFLF
jgi:hypothetical protein